MDKELSDMLCRLPELLSGLADKAKDTGKAVPQYDHGKQQVSSTDEDQADLSEPDADPDDEDQTDQKAKHQLLLIVLGMPDKPNKFGGTDGK